MDAFLKSSKRPASAKIYFRTLENRQSHELSNVSGFQTDWKCHGNNTYGSPAPSSQRLRNNKKNDKLIKTKLFKAQQRFRCGFSEFSLSLCLYLGSGAHTELFRLGDSIVFSAGLNLFALKVVGRVWLSVGVACFETLALTTLLIKGTSTLWFSAPKAMCLDDNQVSLHCLAAWAR